MSYLLDTCLLSELRKPNSNAEVSAWMAGIQPDVVFLSVLTIGEIRRGIELQVPFHLTHSCYDPVGDQACGRCDSCVIRREGFAKVGVVDPVSYAIT